MLRVATCLAGDLRRLRRLPLPYYIRLQPACHTVAAPVTYGCSLRHPRLQVIFVDCDDCLYQNEWATAAKITTSIAAYTANLGVSEEKV